MVPVGRIVFHVVPQSPDLAFPFLQMRAGPHKNFHYLFGCPDTGAGAVVDPAFGLPAVWREAERMGLDVRTAYFTHGHWDHIDGLPAVLDLGVTDVVVHEAARDHPKVQEARDAGTRVRLVRDRDRLQVGSIPVDVLHTPGHQPESTCFLAGPTDGDRLLFGGDCLFVASCGRTDFPGGDTDAMYASMQRIRMLPAPERIHLMPGHDYADAPHLRLDTAMVANPALATRDRTAFERLPFLRG